MLLLVWFRSSCLSLLLSFPLFLPLDTTAGFEKRNRTDELKFAPLREWETSRERSITYGSYIRKRERERELREICSVALYADPWNVLLALFFLRVYIKQTNKTSCSLCLYLQTLPWISDLIQSTTNLSQPARIYTFLQIMPIYFFFSVFPRSFIVFLSLIRELIDSHPWKKSKFNYQILGLTSRCFFFYLCSLFSSSSKKSNWILKNRKLSPSSIFPKDSFFFRNNYEEVVITKIQIYSGPKKYCNLHDNPKLRKI